MPFRCCLWLAALFVAGPVTRAAENTPEARPRLYVPLANSGPVLDGKLDEPCWQDAARTGPLKIVSGEPRKSTMEAFVLRDAENLYVGLSCTEAAPAAAEGQAAKPATAGESVELLINSSGDGNSSYRILLAPASGARWPPPTASSTLPGTTARGNRRSSRSS